MSKVVIVEDEQAIAGMYMFKLQQSGYDVALAHDGEEGLKVIADFRPDLILLDLMIPQLTGSEMLAKIRTTDWGKAIRVIVLTNISETDAPKELQHLDIDRYVVKAQYTPAQVTAIVTAILVTPKKQK